MIVDIEAQKPLPTGGIAGDDIHIWQLELARIDEILADDELILILRRAFGRSNKAAPNRGPRRMALNRLLRTMVIKHIKNWSFRQLYEELQRNLDYRAFTQFFESKIRSVSALCRNCGYLDGQALREINERICQLAKENQVIRGNVFRQDTTVCETNIHYPTDSTLMDDGVRVLTRVVKRAEQLAQSLGKIRDRGRAAIRRVMEINRAVRAKGLQAQERRMKTYRRLMSITRSVFRHASKVANKLDDGRVNRHFGTTQKRKAQEIRRQLETYLPRVEGVLKQTKVRICKGITNYPDKIFSLFEPRTCAIRKGKAHKPTEFGRLVEIDEVEHGFVSDYRVLQGNASDSPLFIPALKRHKLRFGHVPRKVATDRGFWSAKNEKEAYVMGVKRVAIPIRGRLSAARRRIQRSRWFRALIRWRAGGEGRIGTLKNTYGLDRCMYKGNEAMERWIGWCVLANNLVVMARRSQGKAWKRCDGQVDQSKRQSHRKAA